MLGVGLFSVSFFAETAPLAPQKLFEVGPLPFTNSMLLGLICALIVLALFGLAARSSRLWPKSRWAFLVETLIETIFNMLDETFGDRKKTLKHFPLLISLFLFILICNLSGLMPGIETVYYNTSEGLVPLFRSWTTDLNSTIAIAILSLLTVHIYAIKELGGFGYFRHFFSGSLKNPMNIFIGLNELFGEILRLVTLSLRLFGVIYGGEALLFAIAALAGNFGWVATLPVMFLEIFVSLVQAYLFMMLTASYIVMSTSHGGESESHEVKPVVSGA